VRIPALLVSCICLSLPLPAQVPDPGASQDEEAAREKLLKAADQIDLMEGNAEATKTAVEGMKTDLARLRDENAALKLQISSLQDAVQKLEDDRTKEGQVLLDEVARLVASKNSAPAEDRPVSKKKKEVEEDAPSLAPPPDAPTSGPTNPAESAGASDSPATTADNASSSDAAEDAPKPKPHKGYEHVVAPHETLTMICAAYRDQGVKVTVAEIRRANGMTEKSTLKVGQKLFIPKPGT
jgi:regulator of replication initiation timing